MLHASRLMLDACLRGFADPRLREFLLCMHLGPLWCGVDCGKACGSHLLVEAGQLHSGSGVAELEDEDDRVAKVRPSTLLALVSRTHRMSPTRE